MSRLAALVLVSLCFGGSTSRSFPAPKQQPQAIEQLIIGIWETDLKVGDGSAVLTCEFTVGELVISLGETVVERAKYSVLAKNNNVTFEIIGPDGKRRRNRIQGFSKGEMVIIDEGNEKWIFRRRP